MYILVFDNAYKCVKMIKVWPKHVAYIIDCNKVVMSDGHF